VPGQGRGKPDSPLQIHRRNPQAEAAVSQDTEVGQLSFSGPKQIFCDLAFGNCIYDFTINRISVEKVLIAYSQSTEHPEHRYHQNGHLQGQAQMRSIGLKMPLCWRKGLLPDFCAVGAISDVICETGQGICVHKRANLFSNIAPCRMMQGYRCIS
jgi:hypothetical protein